MKSIRRIGLVLLVLFLGILIGNFGIQPALIIFLPLFTLWFMLWDEKNIVKPNSVGFMKNISIMNITYALGNLERKTNVNNRSLHLSTGYHI